MRYFAGSAAIYGDGLAINRAVNGRGKSNTGDGSEVINFEDIGLSLFHLNDIQESTTAAGTPSLENIKKSAIIREKECQMKTQHNDMQ